MKARHSIALLLIVVAAADVADVADGAKRAKKVTADTTITNKVRGRKRGGGWGGVSARHSRGRCTLR